MTYTTNNLLYLPVIELNEIADINRTSRHALGTFMVAVDMATEGTLNQTPANANLSIDNTNTERTGFLFGATPDKGGRIRIDAGIDNDARPPDSATSLEAELRETGYLIEIDHRLGRLARLDGSPLTHSFVDDDNIAMYRLTKAMIQTANDPVQDNPVTSTSADTQVISGLRSTMCQFKIISTQELQQSNFYFTKFGSTTKMDNKTVAAASQPSPNARIIDTLVKVTGMQTGYTLEIPVRFVKLIT